jgi:hypothetical protein
MANSLLTINMITREAVRLWKNTNSFIQNIDTQYDDSFAKTGAKIGTTLRIRLPNDFTVRTGPAASVQDTSEQSTTLTLATQKGVDVSYSSVDRTMSLDDFSRRVLAPMVNNLVGAVAADVMTGVESGVSNFTANQDPTTAVLSTPTASTWLQAGAILDQNSAPRMRRKIIMDPLTQARTVASLSGLFNPSRSISEQYNKGQMQEALGFDWFSDQTVIKHTTASYTGSSSPPVVATTVVGSNQTGTSITVAAITGGLNEGDIITFETTHSVNRITKASNGTLAQFVVTAPVASGGTSIPIYPAMIPASGGHQVQYQTVDVSPTNGDDVSVVTLSGVVYRKNIAYAPEAVTMVTADLELPKGVHEAAREAYDGVSMRMISAYNIMTDQFVTRLDVLYGFLYVRPEWAVAVADVV